MFTREILSTLFSPPQSVSFISQVIGIQLDVIFSAAVVKFCTAYDEYALNAFKTNGIDYILKPFTNGISKEKTPQVLDWLARK
ncbi:hypothetical protein [Pedobacter sp. WC2423]|uniref:hypothetical protein n=1 Tax=Pedobacter sp. WC2423 TaxID=3234142 RepID=UPI00346765F9